MRRLTWLRFVNSLCKVGFLTNEGVLLRLWRPVRSFRHVCHRIYASPPYTWQVLYWTSNLNSYFSYLEGDITSYPWSITDTFRDSDLETSMKWPWDGNYVIAPGAWQELFRAIDIEASCRWLWGCHCGVIAPGSWPPLFELLALKRSFGDIEVAQNNFVLATLFSLKGCSRFTSSKRCLPWTRVPMRMFMSLNYISMPV